MIGIARRITVCVPLLVSVGSLGLASAADAVSLAMQTDKSVYSVGESIVLTLLGGTTGGSGIQAFVDVGYDDALVTEPATASQTAITSFDGFLTWTVIDQPCGPSYCAVFNQIVGQVSTPADPDIEVGTLVLTAAAPGALALTTGISEPVLWFGAPPPPDVTVTIVPEPGTLPLLGLGLLGLCWRRPLARGSAPRR